jgi:uncharacterized protein
MAGTGPARKYPSGFFYPWQRATYQLRFKTLAFHKTIFYSMDSCATQESSMPLDFATAPYGRRTETDAIFARFDAGKNLLMPGPRRLGKTFVLRRLEERGSDHGYAVVSFDVSHCRDERAFFATLCRAIQPKREQGRSLLDSLQQRLKQLVQGSSSGPDSWWQTALNLDWETFADHLIATLAEDPQDRWAILIDELPVFLLHLEATSDGLAQVKSIAYRLREYRERFPQLRWLITGSIGIEPLARRGEYLGAFNNLEPFELSPLTAEAACALLQDWAQARLFEHRQRVSDQEALAIVSASGWLSAYYLEAFGKQLQGSPADDPESALERVADARKRLLQPANRNYFETWPEHIRKNFVEPTRARLFDILAYLADFETGLSADGLLPALSGALLSKKDLLRLLNTLEEDGFLVCDHDADNHRFRMELLRLWWKRYLPE